MPITLQSQKSIFRHDLTKTMAKFGGVGTFVSFRKATMRDIETIDAYMAEGLTWKDFGGEAVQSLKKYTVDDILMFVALLLMVECNIQDSSSGKIRPLFSFEVHNTSYPDNIALHQKNKNAWLSLEELTKEEIVDLCVQSNPELLILSGA